jgi:L-fuconolactonase
MTPAPAVLDTHVHFWKPGLLDYDWLNSAPTLAHPFLPQDFFAEAAGLPLSGAVFVECDCRTDQRHREVEWITSLSERHPQILGMVAQCPLEQGAMLGEELATLAAHPLVKGVRRITQAEPDPEFCLQEGFIEGVRLLGQQGLTCDLCITPRQMNPTIELIRRCPETSFILDHLGKPDIRNTIREPWASQMQELSKLPNVHCKLSGMVTEADHQNWKPDDLSFFFECALETFGPERLIFGGDWPVVHLAASYSKWLETVDRALAGLDDDGRRKIFHSNAIAFYRLSV